MNAHEEEVLEALMFWEQYEVPCDIPATLQSGQPPPLEKLLNRNLKTHSSCLCTVITNSPGNQNGVMGFRVGLEERGRKGIPPSPVHRCQMCAAPSQK